MAIKPINLKKLFVYALTALLALGSTLNVAAQKGKANAKESAALNTQQKAIHMLDRITFGPRPGDVERVAKMGWEKFLDEQLHPERIADDLVEQKLQPIESIHMTSAQLAQNFLPPPQVLAQLKEQREAEQRAKEQNGSEANNQANAQLNNAVEIMKYRKQLKEMGYKPPAQAIMELQQAKILRAVYSERQLQEVLTDFWFNHFNVFAQKGADKVLTTVYERDTIRPNVFGKFEDLLMATAKSPAMLFYLDNWMSSAPNTNALDVLRGARRNQNNNFGGLGGQRAIRRAQRMDNVFSPRVRDVEPMPQEMQQNQQMAQRLKNRKLGINENYAREIMELHTLGVDGGYTQKDVQELARCLTGWTIRQPRQGGEFFFNPRMHDDGEKTVLGLKIPAGGGIKDGEMAIKMLANHPATAKFIATKLARKFVSDNPPESLINRTAQVFLKTKGDLREVYRAIFTSPEFWAAESYRAKIKTPFEMTVSAVRALGAETNGGPQFHRWMAQMGEPLFLAQPPTGYADKAENWVNTGALLNRMNFAIALSGNRIPGTRADLNALQSMTPKEISERLIAQLLHGNISPQTRAMLEKKLAEPEIARADGSADVAKIAGLILGSPEFQRQ
ncbi:MAG TPA: DUF1800 domain-containing protein [Blastocatellia bacterium]|nr:DUF1800 domain-containing protein [Blastocatellia bacterium]